MYTIIHETDDSTAVNFSEYGKFLPGNGMQLVTVGAKHLRLHRPNPYALVPEAEQQWNQTTRLECLMSVRLLAPVKSLAIARIPQNPLCDSLLLGFDNAKLSIVGFNAAERSLKTISLHCFEEEMLRDGYVTDLPSPVIRVDPGQRCAVMLIYGRYLAVLPFDEASPHLHTYTVALSSIDSRLVNVIDMTFLDGYYEPTLVFLFEPAQTTAGRACVRYDTVCMLGVSLNVKEQVHASVWQLNNLPMDCSQLLMIPRPVGGALFIGANELIYLNQSVPPCGILLNSCMDGFTKFPLKDAKEISVTLDGCAACVIAPNKIVVCARSGALFIVTLVVDSTNSVKSLELKREFEVSLPYTLTACSPGYLFVGSRLGDSQFIEYVSELVPLDDPAAKKVKLEQTTQNQLEDEDLELYGKALPSASSQEATVEKMRFRVLDRLLNVAPCKKMTSGCCEGLNSYLQEQPRLDPVFDIVCACGHGKDSSICIFQRSIRPDIITSSSIEGVIQYWAVGRREDDTHMYIIASKELGSLALETDNDLVELEAPIFVTSESTIAAGELADGGLSVQVTTSSIVVVAEGQQIQLVPLQLTFPVLSASIVDPFVAICTQNGKLLLYELENAPHVHLKEVDLSGRLIHNHSPVTALCLYRDMSGIIRFCSSSSATLQNATGVQNKKEADLEDFDDIMLYGDSKKKQKEMRKKRKIVGTRQNVGETPHLETDVIDPNTIVPSHWIVLARENGNLYVYSIPEMQLVYMVKKFNHLPDVAVDEMHFMEDEPVIASDTVNAMNEALVAKPEEVIVEVLLTGMGMNQGRPMLFVMIDDMVSVYEMFMYDNGVVEHLAVRFKRLPQTVVTRSCRFQGNDGRAPVEAGRDTARYKTAMHPFERIGNILNGVFICSSYPCVFLMDSGILRMHPLNLEGPVTSFTAFNNVLCPNGFIYLTEPHWAMRIAKLSMDTELDSSFPVRKIPTGRTIHNVVYLLQSNTYAVVSSEKKRNNKLCVLVNEDKSFEEHEKSDSFVLPELDVYDVKLYSPEDWKPVPNAELKMEDFEVLTSCEEVVPEPGQPTSKHRIKTLYDKEQKGPVTSLCSCNGYLLAGMGQKVFIWLFRDNNLQGISFLDMHFYVHQLVGVRNLALACDIYQSVALLRYQNTRNMVDGDVVFQYLHLSLADKNDLARKLGTSRYHIIDDLTEISRLTTHY
ncbi:putative cleavage and polyadenylation specificity factor subunit 1 [Toxocara canis]|uniref:Putative cleavage and polyadenylation specificity factor subunit 1 n=1 Tax=Toxocara canis TaxID=6265 RepID=A0A0B2VB10_TOXCA|nr:putative cleavage and polyadenylation specificity factor subunit 1 [Toxocara canis]